jgi:hypothetical protein
VGGSIQPGRVVSMTLSLESPSVAVKKRRGRGVGDLGLPISAAEEGAKSQWL